MGFSFNLSDQYPDGDPDFGGLNGSGSRDIFNTPDGTVDDGDRYVIRIRARMDDEDNNGGDADSDDGGPRENIDGGLAGHRLQAQWTSPGQDRQTLNRLSDVDIVEPRLEMTFESLSNGPVLPGDSIAFDISVVNSGTAAGYNVTFAGLLPEENGQGVLMIEQLDMDNSSCDELPGFLDQADALGLTAIFDRLPVDESCNLRLITTVQANVDFEQIHQAGALLTSYDSRADGTDSDNRNYEGPLQEAAFTTDRNPVLFRDRFEAAAPSTGDPLYSSPF